MCLFSILPSTVGGHSTRGTISETETEPSPWKLPEWTWTSWSLALWKINFCFSSFTQSLVFGYSSRNGLAYCLWILLDCVSIAFHENSEGMNAPLLPRGNNTSTRQGCAWWPRRTAGKQKNLISGWYLFYLFTYLFETWYVNQEGLKFPGAYLPAPALSAYVKASTSTPRLTSWFDLLLLLEEVHPRVSMKAKGQSHGAGPLLLPLSSNDWIQGPRAV